MTTGTLTRADLTEAVFQAVGLSRTDSAQMVEDMLEEVCGALSKGETVKLSSFGTFAVRQKSQRMGRNPKTGDEVPIAPRRVLVFRPSHVLKAVINGQTGMSYAPRDVAGLAAAVRAVLDDRDAAQRRAIAARDRLTSDFDWHTVAGETAQVYLAAKRREREPQRRRVIVEHALPDR